MKRNPQEGRCTTRFSVQRKRRRPRRNFQQKKNRDPDAYCDFHKSNGHATNNCETMRKVLAEKFTKGELKGIDLRRHPKKKNFTSQPTGNPSPRKRSRNDDENTQINSQTKQRIDCIIGGSKLCRESINSIKAHQRKLKNTPQAHDFGDRDEALISFKDSETRRLATPHDVALIIELEVSNSIVA